MQLWAEPDGGGAPSGGRVAGPRVGVVRPRPGARRHDLRPLATFEIVDEATAFWRRRIGVVVGVTVAVTLPVQVAGAVACRAELACGGSGSFGWVAALADGRYDPVVVVALWLASVLAVQLAAAAVARLVVADRLGAALPGRMALRAALRRSWALTAAWAIGHAALVLSAVTVVGPLAAMALLLAVTPAIVTEQLGPIRGLRRSMRLGRARFWPMLGVAVASGLVASLLALALTLLPLLLTLLEPLARWEWLLAAAASQLQLLVSVPLTATAATLAYLDVRVRTEGLDLQVDAERAFDGGSHGALVR